MEFGDTNMPIGFAMALAQDVEAMKAFSAMPTEKQDDILASARSVKSRMEMQSLVQEINPGPHKINTRNDIT